MKTHTKHTCPGALFLTCIQFLNLKFLEFWKHHHTDITLFFSTSCLLTCCLSCIAAPLKFYPFLKTFVLDLLIRSYWLYVLYYSKTFIFM